MALPIVVALVALVVIRNVKNSDSAPFKLASVAVGIAIMAIASTLA